MSLLLQITDTGKHLVDSLSHATQRGAAAADQDIRFGDLLTKGGILMIPIGLLLVLALVIFFERYFTIRKASKNESNLTVQVRASILSGNLESAKALCRNSN